MTACGAPEVVTTSMASEGRRPRREEVEGALIESLARRLGLWRVAGADSPRLPGGTGLSALSSGARPC